MQGRLFHIKTDSPSSTIAQIVKENYLAADVFQRNGLSYCCGGHVDLATACAARGLDHKAIRSQLQATTKPVTLPARLDLARWPVSFVIDYMVHVPHAYLKSFLPEFLKNWSAFVTGHQKKFSGLESLEQLIRKVEAHVSDLLAWETQRFFLEWLDILEAPAESRLSLLKEADSRHQLIEDSFSAIRTATDLYQYPSNACVRHQVLYHQLRELDQVYHQYRQLEQDLLLNRLL
ncbi:MAG TPA: DUF542 domain-containing protein [Flavisolibacter sp.]|nr:DUF542 domain-containing protein [Flavisolibacter sp.]